MGKKEKTKKLKRAKSKCCGKFRKKNKYCSRCPVLLRQQCQLQTERSEMGKKKEDKKKAKKKAEKALKKKAAKKKGNKKKDKKNKKKKGKKKK